MSLIEIRVPSVGESITEVTVASLLVEDGATVSINDALCELESDKATFEVYAEQAGQIKFAVEPDQDIAVGALVCTIDTAVTTSKNGATIAAKTEAKKVEVASITQASTAISPTYATGHPSPAAAKLMAENGLTAKQVDGTGVDGRITKEDVLNYLNKQKATPAKSAQPTPPSVVSKSVASILEERGERREKMSRIRKTISRRLLNAKNNTAMLTTFNEVDLTEIIRLRKLYKEAFKEKYGVSLGFMSFFSKAVATALLEFPNINAYIDGDHIQYHDYVDISVAVSSPKGLVVPVVRNVEQLSLQQIESKIKELAIKGRDGKLTMAEMTGGTFTISNGGVFGSLMSTPIINPPQSAILGMHKIQERPMAINGQVEVRPMMYLALSYDHRIVDGKGAVTFLVRIKELLEEPAKLFLGL